MNGTSPEQHCEEVARGDCTPLSERLMEAHEVIVKQQHKTGSWNSIERNRVVETPNISVEG